MGDGTSLQGMATDMVLGVDQILSVLAFPDDGAAALSDAAFHEQMTSHRTRVEQLIQTENDTVTAHAMELTEKLDPFKHTYSYLALLEAMAPMYTTHDPVNEPLVSCVARFLIDFDARQVRYIGYGLTRLLSWLASGAAMPATCAVKLIMHALATIDHDGHMFTSTHLPLVRLAYHTRIERLVMPFLRKRIVFFPAANPLLPPEPICSLNLPPPAYITKDTGLTLQVSTAQILEYSFLVGNMFLVSGDYKEAIEAFAQAASHPTRDNGVSKIMAAAHRRWLLTSLVYYGKAEAAPPHTTAGVARIYGIVNKVYARMAELFQNPSPAGLCAEVTLAAEQLRAARDWALVQMVVGSHSKWQVARLRDVFLTIAIADVKKALPDETEAAVAAITGVRQTVEDLIYGMIGDGLITAEVVQAPEGAYLHFLPEQVCANEKELAVALHAAGDGMTEVRRLNTITSQQLSLNRDFIRQTIKEQKAAAKADSLDGGGDGYKDPRYSGIDAELDEDLMTDGVHDYGL